MTEASFRDFWWLDESALPDFLWACLRVHLSGRAEVLDCDGQMHRFDDEDAAKRFLLEDEYRSLDRLVSDGAVDPWVQPPEAAHFDSLVRRMIDRRGPK